ncbi:response regulator [Deinococcus pimensis]|uniref:response regulator n=1 Tax=Deinococcus pimensis TaxID=309888 RepID=UPI0004AEEFC7|nr:response regulator [Deinococcus pimensis]
MYRHAPVLLVDDSVEDLELALVATDAVLPDVEVVGFTRAEDALAWLRGRAAARLPLPFLTLLDWKMPGMGGRDLLMEMRAASDLNRTPVVVFTTSREERDVHLAYSLGANAFLRKPSGLDELKVLLERTVRFWRINVTPTRTPAAS